MFLDKKYVGRVNKKLAQKMSHYLENNDWEYVADFLYKKETDTGFIEYVGSANLHIDRSFMISLNVQNKKINAYMVRFFGKESKKVIFLDKKLFRLDGTLDSINDMAAMIFEILVDRLESFFAWSRPNYSIEKMYELDMLERQGHKHDKEFQVFIGGGGPSSRMTRMLIYNEISDEAYAQAYKEAVEFFVRAQYNWLSDKEKFASDDISNYFFEASSGIKKVIDLHYMLRPKEYAKLLESKPDSL